MAQAAGSREFTTFVKGIITEANPLTFPENASIDEQNFVLNRDGSRSRRLGVDYEDNYNVVQTDIVNNNNSNVFYNTYTWRNAIESTGEDIYVVAIYRTLYFFRADNNRISDDLILEITIPAPYFGFLDHVDFAALSTHLVVSYGGKNVYTFKYDQNTDTLIVGVAGLLVRDIWGVEDELKLDERPTTLTDEHNYNLHNQGWGGIDPDTSTTYIQSFFNETGAYPSNSDLIYLGKSPLAGETNTDYNSFDPKLVERSFFGAGQSPQGKFIIDVFDRGATRELEYSGVALINNYDAADFQSVVQGGPPATVGGFWNNTVDYDGYTISVNGSYQNLDSTGIVKDITLKQDETEGKVISVAGYSGRFFYAMKGGYPIDGDTRSPILASQILYSQQVTAEDKIGKCYQEADPTSEDFSDLVATDGGSIEIPDLGEVYKLVPLSRSLVIISSAGIWEISGGESNFSATDFQVSKVSDVGGISGQNIVATESAIFYWSPGGIYSISTDQVSLNLVVTNVTENTIQSIYNTIPKSCREACFGTYSSSQKQVRWALCDYEVSGLAQRTNTELVLDLVLGAFYINKFDSLTEPEPNTDMTPHILGYMRVYDTIYDETQTVIDYGVNRSVADWVYVVSEPYLNGSSVTPRIGLTFAYQRNKDFEDFGSTRPGEFDATANLLTGYDTLGNAQNRKQLSYVVPHFERTEKELVEISPNNYEPSHQSSCKMRVAWDFVNDFSNAKVSQEQQVYRFNTNLISGGVGQEFGYPFDVITTKNKIRGSGRALSIYFETEPTKDCVLLGWSNNYVGNTNV